MPRRVLPWLFATGWAFAAMTTPAMAGEPEPTPPSQQAEAVASSIVLGSFALGAIAGRAIWPEV